jgi:hypothetical protein
MLGQRFPLSNLVFGRLNTYYNFLLQNENGSVKNHIKSRIEFQLIAFTPYTYMAAS